MQDKHSKNRNNFLRIISLQTQKGGLGDVPPATKNFKDSANIGQNLSELKKKFC